MKNNVTPGRYRDYAFRTKKRRQSNCIVNENVLAIENCV